MDCWRKAARELGLTDRNLRTWDVDEGRSRQGRMPVIERSRVSGDAAVQGPPFRPWIASLHLIRVEARGKQSMTPPRA